MASSYSEKIAKLKNALENVFVKKTDIQNNLTSTDTNKPLSANQGKVLKTLVDAKANANNVYTKTEIDNLIGDIEEDMLS